MLHLPEIDYAQIRAAREKEIGALIEIDNHRITSSEGTIFIGCPDADQFRDVYYYHCKICELDRHHPLCLNGGALLLSRHSPIPGAKMDGKVLSRHARKAAKIKGMHTVILYVHAPCGVATAAELDFFEIMRLLIEAKLRLRSQKTFDKIKIACFCHVDFNSNPAEGAKKRTYFVHREAMTRFLESRDRQVRV